MKMMRLKYVIEVGPQGIVASSKDNKDYGITNRFTLVNFVKWGMDEEWDDYG